MAIVLLSPHRWLIPLVIVAASMLATADASAGETMGKARSAALHPVTRGRPIAPAADAPDADLGRVDPAVRIVSQRHVRVTRLRNGSILCCREVPPLHLVAVCSDANDDTASDGDESSDDDDSQDDQNGADDTESPTIAWLPAMVLYVIAP